MEQKEDESVGKKIGRNQCLFLKLLKYVAETDKQKTLISLVAEKKQPECRTQKFRIASKRQSNGKTIHNCMRYA